MSLFHKPPAIPLWLAVLPLIFTVGLIAIQLIIFENFDPQVPLIFGIFFTATLGVLRGWKWPDLETGMFKIVIVALPAIAILLLIGIIIGTWIASGTVPYLIYYGLQILSPKIFLVTGFILCSIMSLALGTSWGTLGTLGIVILGIGDTLGFPEWMTTGAVVAGSFFGDKLSPISDTTNLAPAVTGTKLFDHIRGMLPTTVPAMVAGLVVYLLIGLFYQNPEMEHERILMLKNAIETNFELSWIAILPPVVIAIMAIRGYAAIPSMFGGVVSGLLIALFLQGDSFGEIFNTLKSGYILDTGEPLVDTLFTRGGIVSMTDPLTLVFFALTFGGLLEHIGCFDVITRWLLKRIKRFWQLQQSAIMGTFLMCAGTGDCYLPMAFIGRLFSKAYDRFGYSRLNLSRAIEESGTLMSPLIPWTASGIFISATLGLGIKDGATENLLYIPLAIGCWLSPLLGMIFPMLGIYSKKATEEEIRNYTLSLDQDQGHLTQPVRSFLRWFNPPASAYISTPEIALKCGVKDTNLPLKHALEKGNMGFGLGKDNKRYILVDPSGAYYCNPDGKPEEAEGEDTVSIINLLHFNPDTEEELSNVKDPSIRKLLPVMFPSDNLIYGIMMEGEFKKVDLQFLPDDETNHTYKNMNGMIFGLYYPGFLHPIHSGGIHLYFMSGDGSLCGKVVDGLIDSVNIGIQQIPKLETSFPVTVEYLIADIGDP